MKDFFKFLKDTPANLLNIITVWAVSILLLTLIIFGPSRLEPPWIASMLVIFVLVVMLMAVVRVWLIYKRL